MRVLITGADGFLGRRVVDKLLALDSLGQGFDPISELVLLDVAFRRLMSDPRVKCVEGSFVDEVVRNTALAKNVDVMFHLASLPGGAAQSRYELGRSVNLEAPMALVDALYKCSSKPPIVVNASSIAVIGPTTSSEITEDSPLRPVGSYGAHKLMLELHLADLTSRGWIDARSVRPAGIVPRPRSRFEGFATAWMSEMFHAMYEGEPFTVPTSPESRTWLQSVDCVAENFLIAARLPSDALPTHRAWTLPALNPTMRDLIAALGAYTSPSHVRHIAFSAPPAGPFGRGLPDQRLRQTEALGFHHDGSLDMLVRNALHEILHASHPTETYE